MKTIFYIGANQFGGAERVMVNLCNEFVERNHEVTLLLNGHSTGGYKLDKRVKVIVGEDSIRSVRSRVSKQIELLVALRNIVRNEQPDVMLSFLFENNIRAILVGKSLSIPVVISVRVDPRMECTSLTRRFIRSVFYNHADGVVIQNEGSRKRFGRWFHADYKVIPNPINESFFKEVQLENRKKLIVAMGRLSEQKNHLMLIRAFALLADSYPEYKLVIFGEGKLRNKLEEEITIQDMEKRIYLPGAVKDVQDYLRLADVFVLCSDYEGVPNALLEAMSMGIPCIATDVPNEGCRDVIKDHVNGILIPTHDIDELVIAIRFMLDNREEAIKMGMEAKKVRENYSPKYVYDEWEEYLSSF